jgi:hypothetical protein
MRRCLLLVVLAEVLGISGCGECNASAGCLAASSSSGSCECLEWEVVSDEVVPIKFLVTGVLIPAPGNLSVVGYGSVASPPSQQGTRFRAVLKDAQGKETVLHARVPTETPGNSGLLLQQLGETTVSLGLPAGFGFGLEGGGSGLDLPPAIEHRIQLWTNPTLRLVRDAGGNLRGIWGWEGACSSPGLCNTTTVAELRVGDLDGSFPPGPGSTYLGVLGEDERAAILAFDRFAAQPPPTTEELSADPRFLRLGDGVVDPQGSTTPSTSWSPCSGTAKDDDFPVLASTTVPLDNSETLLVQQSWLTTSVTCSVQSPKLSLGTSATGCRTTATAYLDRLFGMLGFIASSTGSGCTGP